MADDIDIEEHDVLDNPHIKNIFPDISNIKTEVIDIEYEDYDTENYGATQYNSRFDYYEEDLSSFYQNRIILGTKPSVSDSSSDDESIIVPKLSETFVVLEDWGKILENSPCYCHSCQILFPTENALDSHKMTAHSFLVAVGNNKAIKSTSKSSISARLQFERDEVIEETDENFCNHCNVMFPNQIALLKHSYEMFPRKFDCEFCDQVFDSEMSRKIHQIIHSIVECYRCPICSCYFKYGNKLMSHVSHQHQMNLADLPDRVVTNYRCAFCAAKFKNNKSYNGHIYYHHADFYNKIADTVHFEKFKCFPCNITFPSAYSEKIHRVAQHAVPNDAGNRKEIDLRIKTEGNNSKTVQRIDLNRRPIPKSTLFKCNKCQLHFVTCGVAVEHAKRCVLKKGEWKCKQCRRPFKLIDRENHLTQHRSTERFKVITIDDNTLNKLICRCKSCYICFDEKTLLKYHINGCTDTDSVNCNVCSFRVHEHAMTKHKRLHNELGSEQFFVVDYVSFDKLATEKVKVDTTCAKEPRLNKKEKFYYYCPTCQCCMKVNKLPDKHNVGKCNRYLIKTICKMCGLKFSTKSFKSHKNEHKRFPNLSIRDLTFKSTQSLKKINPPFPDFKKCNRCKVKFFSGMALRSHVCDMEEAKTCAYCGEKFSDLAYKLHVPFHEYSGSEKKQVTSKNIPELIKKYESLKIVWNILYLCEICDTILDDYDDVIEHSQNHYCNMESYSVTINRCSICDIQIVGNCYERHKQLHLTNTVTKSSFNILRYKYDSLLTTDWFNIFSTLAKEQVDHILNKSKYRYTRSVRMEVLIDGPIDLTLYKCVACDVIVDCTAIDEHAQNKMNCVNPTKFDCTICGLSFSTRNFLNSHVSMHDNRLITNKTFRVISFNDDKDLFINDSLRSKINPESLKFIRCQHCGKLINKSKYKKHVEYHRYMARKKTTKAQPKFVIRSKFKKVDKRLVHNFYKCHKCSVCVFRNNVAKHFCSTSKHKKQCLKCHLFFRSTHMSKHMLYHEKYKLTKTNVHVYVFKNGKIEEETRKQDEVILYQCSDCGVCLHKEMNIKRHICISANYQKVCRICEMPFHCSRMHIHGKMHEDKNFSKSNIVVKKFKSKDVLKYPQKNKTFSLINHKKPTFFKRKLTLNKNNLKSEVDDPAFLRFVHSRNYKCLNCKLLFVTPSGLLKHQHCCFDDNRGVKCDNCGLVYHNTMIRLHKKLQICPPSDSKLYNVTIDRNEGQVYDDKKCLYLCKECKIYLTSFKAICNHFKRDHQIMRKPRHCDVCDILLTSQSCPRHKLIHHIRHNLSLGDLLRFDVTAVSLSEALDDIPSSDMVNIVDYDSDLESNDDSKSNESLENVVTVKDDVKISTPNKSVKNYPNGGIYRCDVCELNFLHVRTLELHVSTGRHNERRFNCPECDLIFTQNSLTRHMKLHHDSIDFVTNIHRSKKKSVYNETDERNISLNKSSKDLSEDKLNTTKSDSAMDETDDNEKHVAVKRKCCVEDDVPNKQIKLDTKKHSFRDEIFTCYICELNFLHRRTLNRHVSKACHNISKYHCPECDLIFTQNSLTRHRKLHHDLNSSSDTITSKPSTPRLKQTRIYTECEEIETLTDTEERVMEERVAKERVMEERVAEEGVKKPKEHLTNKPVNKLYKCSDCDVYYMHQDACKEHVTNHEPLDPTEYIACKLCDLQFLCEYLGSHMKGHRERTFNIDDLIVEEYHVVDGKVDTYSAADRLKSKLVTTTTDFDTEDEKIDRDESRIDSTASVYATRPVKDDKVNIEANDIDNIKAPSTEVRNELTVQNTFLISPANMP